MGLCNFTMLSICLSLTSPSAFESDMSFAPKGARLNISAQVGRTTPSESNFVVGYIHGWQWHSSSSSSIPPPPKCGFAVWNCDARVSRDSGEGGREGGREMTLMGN